VEIGSRAEVGSSMSKMSGFIASAGHAKPLLLTAGKIHGGFI